MRRALFALFVPVAATVASCLGPTEIVVAISTNACPALAHTDIYVDGNQVGLAQTPACDPNNPLAKIDLGNITILPTHGIDSTVDIALVGAVGGACASPGTTEHGCIIARRTLSFIPHTRLDLPIFLDNACANLPCASNETCEVDEKVGAHCVPAGCGTADTEPCVADGGSADAGPIGDVAVDAPPPACPASLPISINPTLSWSFEQLTIDQQLHDDDSLIAPAPTLGSLIAATPPNFCGLYLDVTKAAQVLVPNGSKYLTDIRDASFALGFAFFAAADGPIFETTYSSQFGAFQILISNGALQVRLDTPGQSNPIYTTPTIVADKQWHRFGIELKTDPTTSVVSIYNDGKPVAPITIPAYLPGTILSFSVGPIAGVDQIVFFAN